ncbi:MAG TPA: polysaccharide pyruvyl transferase family protein [bacterium]|nr:polysaccharide pyruvyl transferase family protein [bacterium]HQI47245.1 polysaccharide pyruvyl transferase family protein [bacterium]HQJ64246.1 polysaccharide pyruvyl transferase family protein [bacterium]
MKTINVIGNFSGRNAGDAAILGGVLEDISQRYPEVLFTIPTINPGFVQRQFAEYRIQPVPMTPWHGSMKILGYPVLRAMREADLILVTDAILFDRKLYNPLFNYLWTLSHFLPRAWHKGVPIVLYNCSLGPIRTSAGHVALQRILDHTSALILRDQESVELLERQGFQHPRVIEGADCALNAKPVDEARLEEICRDAGLFSSGRPVIGFNVNSYVDAFVRQGGTFGRDNLVELYAATVDRVISELDVDVLFVETQHMDMGIATQVLGRIHHRDRVRMISNKVYTYREICAVLQRVQLFAGMRTHSLILSSAMGVPPVGIVTYPKNRGYMRTIGMEAHLVDFKELAVESFFARIHAAWSDRERIRAVMLPQVAREKEKARRSAEVLKEYLG